MGYNKTKTSLISNLWDAQTSHEMTCPDCGGHLIIVQMNPIEDMQNPYTPFETFIECSNCAFQTHTISFTILGSVDTFDHDRATIIGWSPSGSRVKSTFEHILDYEQLKKMQNSEELAEFLVVDDHIVQIIQ